MAASGWRPCCRDAGYARESANPGTLERARIYEPALLLNGTVGEIVLHVTSCAIGIVCWSLGLEGWLRGAIGAAPRTLLFVAGAILIWPVPSVNLAARVLGAAVLVPAPVARREPSPTLGTER